MKATKVAYSSIVGQSIMLHDHTGRAIGQLSVMSHEFEKEHKEAVTELADRVCAAINNAEDNRTPREREEHREDLDKRLTDPEIREMAGLPRERNPDTIQTLTQQEIIKAGFTGDFCTNCGSSMLVRTGACVTCQSCGSNTGCS